MKFTEKGSVDVYYTLYKRPNGCSYVEVQVKDTGCGIKEEDFDKLFELYGFMSSSIDINTSGIGLGLTITKKITS